MPRYYLRKLSAVHKWIYLVNGHDERSEKGRPKRVPVNTYEQWTYTVDELARMDYEGFEPMEVDE